MLTLLLATTTYSASYHPFALRALLPSQTAGVGGADAVANIAVNTSPTAVPMTLASFDHNWSSPGQLPALVTSSVSEKLPATTLYASSSGQLPAVVITAAGAGPVDRIRPYAGQLQAVVTSPAIEKVFATSPVDRSRPYSEQLPAVVPSQVIEKVDATSPADRSRPYSGQLPAVILTDDNGSEEVPALPALPGDQVCVYWPQ
jgi:hypothetical protein